MSSPIPNAAETCAAGDLEEMERQEKNLVFHLQEMFLEDNYKGFERANEELSAVRTRIYAILNKNRHQYRV